MIPKIIYGTAWKKEKTKELVIKALQYGFRGIDTACQPKHYNEAGVGQALKQVEGIARHELYIQTKFTPLPGQDPSNVPYDRKAPLPEQVFQSFEVSKKNLGIDYLDGWILHSPLENIDRTLMVWQAMEKIYKQGGAKRLGISNCYDLGMFIELYHAAEVKPTLLQNRFYPETDYDRDLRQWFLDKKIIYQSFWTLTANPHLLGHEVIQKTAQTYQKTPAQILFRVLMDIGIVPLTGTSSEQHMEEDLEILNLHMPASVIREVTALFDTL